jgi:hypothetical protein
MHHPAGPDRVTHRLPTWLETHGATSFAAGQTIFHGDRPAGPANSDHLGI